MKNTFKFSCILFAILIVFAFSTNAQAGGTTISISSFDELKPYLEYRTLDRTKATNIGFNADQERLFLKGGNYSIDKSFEIDMADNFFAGKADVIKYGIISADENFTINGKANTISVKQENAVAVFSTLVADKFTIENLNISYPKNVAGYGFAQNLYSKDLNEGFASAKGTLKNIEVSVGGDITPLRVFDKVKNSKQFPITPIDGLMSCGFSWHIEHINLDNITVNIKGNIGSTDRPEKDDDLVFAHGFTFDFENVPYNDSENNNKKTWEALFNDGNPEPLKDAGHVLGLTINVGGNIQAYGNNAGYSSGFGMDAGDTWIDNAKINIEGNIITDLKGNTTPMKGAFYNCYAYGLSRELMNFTNSSLSVNNIIFKSENLPDKSSYNFVGATARYNTKGNYINIKNNNIKVKGLIQGNSDKNIISSASLYNDWSSYGKRGVDWPQIIENNKYEVGGIDLTSSDKSVTLLSFGEKCRTGIKQRGTYKLPSASLNHNELTVGDINIKAKEADVSLLMQNSSNAKDNKLQYGNVSITAGRVDFYGMGHAFNNNPVDNLGYNNVMENNTLSVKDLTINADKSNMISLMVAYQDENQPMKNGYAKVDNVNINIKNADATSFIGGISGYSKSDIDSCRLDVGSVNLTRGDGPETLYFGLGAGYKTSSTIKNSAVFVDGDLNVSAKERFGGGFIGSVSNSKIINNNLQVDGKSNVNLTAGFYGGFVGRTSNSAIYLNTSLYLNEFMPFAFKAENGGAINSNAHYTNGKAPMLFSGLLAIGDQTSDKRTKLENNTLLVEKPYEDTIGYIKQSASADSKDNYLVVVDIGNKFNRTAYKLAEANSTQEELGAVVPVFKKQGDPIGRINIAKRSFQDKYWNPNFAPYEIGQAEKNFSYVTANEVGELVCVGADAEIASVDASTVKLSDYYHRHLGVVDGLGVAYDLLGIKGGLVKDPTTNDNSADNTSKYPSTGDSANISLYILLSILSLGILIVLSKNKTKEN